MNNTALTSIVKALIAPSKGILALDWSKETITKKFSEVGVTSTPEVNRVYRQMLIETPGIESFVSGIILNEETTRQKTDEGIPFPEFISSKGIVPGVRADRGGESFGGGEEEVTVGIENLNSRLKEFVPMDLKFTKWRAVFKISDIYPSREFLEEDLSRLVKFATVSLENNFIPIVEPEVSMKGSHTTTSCAETTTLVLTTMFNKLKKGNVDLKNIILKTNMVIPGQDSGMKAELLEVAEATLRTLKNSVPPEVPGIVFLSGGQSPDEATLNLNEIVKRKEDTPWDISFSFARALQGEALTAWAGKEENVVAAQQALLARLEKVSKARMGEL